MTLLGRDASRRRHQGKMQDLGFELMPLLEIAKEILPPDVANTLREAVEKAANSRRGSPTSSYWYSLESKPRNILEEVIPILRAVVPFTVSEECIGVDWWLGMLHPPYAENFPYGLHRDGGRNPVSGNIEGPSLSTVLYLTEVDDGALAVYSGEPDSIVGDIRYAFPRANSFAMFSGELLHNVVSRKSIIGIDSSTPSSGVRLSVQYNWWKFRPGRGNLGETAADYSAEIYPELLSGV
ncbi:hypothetical protein ACFYW6_40405 [Streptomyces sp. NPDC002659]|uniref:hypothetical protein n=1 Tax=Streptomyces sp. NPDC002659 TaxID=3364656 RepID=UPI0036812F9A